MEDSSAQTATTPYGFIRDGKVYRNAFLEFPERQIGEVKNDEAFSIRYFTRRFEIIKEKTEALLTAIAEAQNKGSFMMKLLHLRSILPTFDALGDFIPLDDRLREVQEEIMALIEVNRIKNLEIKRALLADTTEAIADVTDWSASGEKVKVLKEKWLKTGSVAQEHEEETEGAFTALLNDFYHRRKLFYDDRQRVMFERIALYQAVLDKALPLADPHMNAGQAMRTFKNLQNEWRAVGLIPKAHLEPIIVAFKRVGKTIMRNMKYQKDKERSGRPLTAEEKMHLENLKQKKSLIEQAKALGGIDLRQAFEKARELQALWKNIGPVPERDKRYANDAFTYACDRIFEMSYLMRTVYVSNRFFNSKSTGDQYNIKIQTMKEIIRKDELELDSLSAVFDKLSQADQRAPQNKPLYSKISTQKRKLKVKQQLLGEMQEQAVAIAGSH
ncbi:MAG: DUF349 domain-containing protein [Bacteroidota bacterium]